MQLPPAGILAVDSRERDRVILFELAEQFGQRPGCKFRPQGGTGRGRVTQPVEKRLEIKSCAAAENRDAPALLNISNGRAREFGKPRGVERLVQLDHINQMMAHALPFPG